MEQAALQAVPRPAGDSRRGRQAGTLPETPPQQQRTCAAVNTEIACRKTSAVRANSGIFINADWCTYLYVQSSTIVH